MTTNMLASGIDVINYMVVICLDVEYYGDSGNNDHVRLDTKTI